MKQLHKKSMHNSEDDVDDYGFHSFVYSGGIGLIS